MESLLCSKRARKLKERLSDAARKCFDYNIKQHSRVNCASHTDDRVNATSIQKHCSVAAHSWPKLIAFVAVKSTSFDQNSLTFRGDEKILCRFAAEYSTVYSLCCFAWAAILNVNINIQYEKLLVSASCI